MVVEPTEKYSARYLKNKNKLIFEDDNCIGVKTGFTDNAGRCLVNAHEENGMQIISVVLNYIFALLIRKYHNKKKYFDDYIIYQDKKYVSLQWYLD
jgi:D-alanyl-D-alanine carboxypeptidase